MELNIPKIQAELQELAGEQKVKVKTNNHLVVSCSIRETDNRVDITFNPKRIRSPKRLDEHLAICRESICHHDIG